MPTIHYPAKSASLAEFPGIAFLNKRIRLTDP